MTLSIASAEKDVIITETKFDNPNLIEMQYKGQDGFWLSTYLAGEGAKALNQLEALKRTLGFTEDNFTTKTKYYWRLDLVNKVLIGITIGGFFLFLALIIGVAVGLYILEKGVIINENLLR